MIIILYFSLITGCAISLLLVAITFFAGNKYPMLSVFGLALYLSAFSLGLGPGAWLIPSEVYTTSIRAKAMSLTTFLNRAFATIMSSTFLSMAHLITWGGFFLAISVICFLFMIFFHVYVPETKGRALEDMAFYFAEITGDKSVLDVELKHQHQHQHPESLGGDDSNELT